MRVKIINGKVYGADLTAKEREALNIEVRKALAEQAKKYADDFDASVLYQIHAQYSKKAKALRRFYDQWKTIHNGLIQHYELDNADAPWLFAEKLKQIDVDVAEWNKESAT